MPKKANQKLRLLEVLKILQRYSDENHTLTVEEIQKKLSLAGMYAERKAIYDDLYALEEGGYDCSPAPTKPLNVSFFWTLLPPPASFRRIKACVSWRKSARKLLSTREYP